MYPLNINTNCALLGISCNDKPKVILLIIRVKRVIVVY